MPSLYTTRQLLATTKQFPPVSLSLVDMFFPARYLSVTEKIALDKIDEDRKIAAYVSPLVAAKSSLSAPRRVEEYTPPSVIEMDQIRVDEITHRLPGEDFSTPLSPEARHAAILQEKRFRQIQRISRRYIQQALSVLTTGSIVVSGDDHPPDQIDFGRDASLTVTLSGANAWSSSTSDPIGDLESMSDAIADLCGATSTNVVMGLGAWSLFRNNEAVQKQLNINRLPELTALNADPATNGRGLRSRGRFGDFDISTYAESWQDDSGVLQKFMPTNGVIIGGPDIRGTIAFGGVALVENDTTVVYAGEIIPDHFSQKNPDGEFLRSQSRPLVIPVEPNASAFLKVA